MTTDRESAGPAFVPSGLEVQDDLEDLDVLSERYQRAREAVIQSEARYRNLFEAATDATYTVGLDGSFTSVNEAMVRLTGLAKTDLLGCSSRMLFDEDQLALVREEFRRTLAGTAVRFECRLRRANGDYRLVSVSNTTLRVARDVVGVLGVARDVTVEHERAVALERAEARSRQLMESTSDGMFTVDTAGRFTGASHSLGRSVGRTREELIGAPFVGLVDARDLASAQQILRDILAGQRCRGVLRYHAADGGVRHGSLTGSPIIEEDAIVGALFILHDASDDQGLAEQRLTGAANELHELLAGVAANADRVLASLPATDAGARQAMESIRLDTARATRIASQLPALARRQPTVTT